MRHTIVTEDLNIVIHIVKLNLTSSRLEVVELRNEQNKHSD
jgi:hypothetical protein